MKRLPNWLPHSLAALRKDTRVWAVLLQFLLLSSPLCANAAPAPAPASAELYQNPVQLLDTVPVFSPGTGAYTAAQTVTITDTTPGAQIFYTTDGTTPTANSTPYYEPIAVSASVTLKAVAIAGAVRSPIVQATYNFQQMWPVAAFGTSITDGNLDGTGIRYPVELAAMTGQPVKNLGIGGETSTQVAVRMNAYAATINQTIAAPLTIPTSGGVPITFPVGFEGCYHAPVGDGILISIASSPPVTGYCTDDMSGNFTFTPVAYPANPVYVVAGTAWTAVLGNWLNECVGIEEGANNASNPAQVLADIAASVAVVQQTTGCYYVLAVSNSESPQTWEGTPDYDAIIAMDATLSEAYGTHFIDTRSNLIANYDPNNPNDVIDQENDVPPYSLRALDVRGTLAASIPDTVSCGLQITPAAGSALVENGVIITVDSEQILLVAETGGSWSCMRGFSGTAPATHASGAPVTGVDYLHPGQNQTSSANPNCTNGYVCMAQQIYEWMQVNSPQVVSKAVLTSPSPGNTLPGANAVFSWTPGLGVSVYNLYLGTTGVGSSDLFTAGVTNTTSASVTGLPTYGQTIYARLWSMINGAWQSTDYTYTEAGTPTPAALTSPTPGSVLQGSSVTFSWTPGGGVSNYNLYLGTTGIGSSNLFTAGVGTATSASVTGLPAYGQIIYARLYSRINGAWQSVDYTYTEAGSPLPAALISPNPGSTLPGSNATFSWTPGVGVSNYNLYLGTTGVGSYNLFTAGVGTTTSAAVTGLPAYGQTIYARLYSRIDGAWQYADYTYTEAGTPVPATLTSPPPSSTLSGNTTTFSWTPGVGVSAYNLYLGTTGVGSSNLFVAGSSAATSVTASGLPTRGQTIYARLYSKINGVWQSTDYIYTEAAPSVLTVTAANATRAYATANPAFTYTITGFVDGDTQSVVSGTPVLTTAANLQSPVGNYPITAASGSLSAANYTFTFVQGTLSVAQATPSLTWTQPASILYGTALSAAQLNASATVPGTLTYSPAAGTVLGAGPQTLSVAFTPADAADYTTAAFSVPLTVAQAPPAVTWQTPPAIGYGTALGAAQLNATSTVPGSFRYSPCAGTVPGAGMVTLYVTFTPSDTTDYVPTTSSVQLSVNQVAPSITWPAPAPITYGAALGGTQLNAASTVPGTFSYSPPAGAVPGAGVQFLSVTFTPTDSSDYTTSAASVPLIVAPATPSISWASPAPVIYGTALGAAQLNASSVVPGTFAYSPAAGTVPGAGSQTLAVTFTPSDATDFTAASSSVQLSVMPATPPITWPAPAPIAYGTALSAAQLNASSAVPGTFTYSPAAGTVLPAGLQTLSAVFTPTDTVDYLPATATTQLAVALQSFNAVSVGSASATVPVSFTFSNAVTLGASLVLTQGAAGLDFTDAGSDTCTAGSTFAAGSSCVVNVTFTPLLAGLRQGAVELQDGSGNILATAYVAGVGTGPQVNFLPGTQATIETSALNQPSAIAVDSSGSIYIADSQNNRVLKESPQAGALAESVIGTGLSGPQGVAIDGAGNVYISDTQNNRVVMETPSASGYAQSTVDASGLAQPAGIAVDSNGNLYIADAGNGRVVMETLVTGSYAQTTIASGLTNPQGIAVDGSGNVYVAAGAAYEESPASAGYTQSQIGSGFTAAQAVGVDSQGNVYIADLGSNQVFEEAPSSGGFVQSTVAIGGLAAPSGVAVDGNGNVYVASAASNAVFEENFAAPPSLGFASTMVGATSADSPQPVTVKNVGNAPLSLPVPGSGSNPAVSANFAVSSGGTSGCSIVQSGGATAATLAAGASCTLAVSFQPASAGPLTGALAITDNQLNAAAPGFATQSIALFGTATPATPSITWAAPASIPYGTPLSATQFNASSSVAGAFNYSPPLGTVPGAGLQTLSVTFTPTDTTDYATVTASVQLTVTQATPSIAWTAPAAITYGTALSAAQLNAGSTVPGTFTYSPPTGAVLAAGQQTLAVTFTPTDTADYTTATASVQLTVTPATPAITWPTPIGIPYGTALSGAQLNAATTIAGAFSYSPAAGAVLTAGRQTLAVTFTPTDTTDYVTTTSSVQLTVTPAMPAIAWAAPAPIICGTALTTAQLNARAALPGTFTYSPPPGTVLTAGPQTLAVIFTPNDNIDYATASATVPLTVMPLAPASLTLPSPGAQLAGSSATFSWSAGTGVSAYFFELGTSGAGSYNLYSSGATMALTAAVTGLPTTGQTIYARVGSKINGVWQTSDFTYVAAPPVLAALAGPLPGTQLAGSAVTFSWSPGSGVSEYFLALGTGGIGSSNLYNPGPTTALSASVTGLPANGQTIYARLGSKVNGVWQTADSTYMEAVPLPAPASMVSPVPATQLAGSSTTFTWTAGTAVTEYFVSIGTTGAGSHNLYDPGPTTALSATVTGLPTSGQTIYVRLGSKIDNAWQTADYTYTEAAPVPVAAAIASPSPGAQLAGSSATFAWTTGTAVSEYFLAIGSNGVGSNNLYNPGPTTTLGATVTNLPTNGKTIYVRLGSKINNVWQTADYTYVEAVPVPVLAAITSPAPGAQLAGAGATFTWTAGTAVSEYFLAIGSNGVGSNNLYNPGPTTALTATVANLPTNGETIYVRLGSKINNVWQTADYTYTAQ